MLSASQFLSEVGDGLFQTLFKSDGGCPSQFLFCEGDVRTTLRRIIGGQGAILQPTGGVDVLQHNCRQLPNSEFSGVSQIDRPEKACFIIHHPYHAFNEIVDVLERSRLFPFPVDGDGIAPQRLADEVGYDPAVVRVHERTVCVENADDADVRSFMAMVIEHEAFRATLSLIVACSDSNGVDVAPVAFRLGVHEWLSIDFRR